MQAWDGTRGIVQGLRERPAGIAPAAHGRLWRSRAARRRPSAPRGSQQTIRCARLCKHGGEPAAWL